MGEMEGGRFRGDLGENTEGEGGSLDRDGWM